MKNNESVITTVDALHSLLTEFRVVLEQEQHALLQLTEDQVAIVASRKEALLQRISHVHPDLLHRIKNSSVNHDKGNPMEKISRLIELCSSYNRDNGALVAQGLKMCRNSIGFLQSNMNQLSVELYDFTGQAKSDPIRRDIGQA